MSALTGWLVRAGFDLDALRRRVLGGVVLGLTVVAIDRVMGFGS